MPSWMRNCQKKWRETFFCAVVRIGQNNNNFGENFFPSVSEAMHNPCAKNSFRRTVSRWKRSIAIQNLEFISILNIYCHPKWGFFLLPESRTFFRTYEKTLCTKISLILVGITVLLAFMTISRDGEPLFPIFRYLLVNSSQFSGFHWMRNYGFWMFNGSSNEKCVLRSQFKIAELIWAYIFLFRDQKLLCVCEYFGYDMDSFMLFGI